MKKTTTLHFIPGSSAHSARTVSASLPNGQMVHLSAMGRSDCISLSLTDTSSASTLYFTAAQARSVAAELLACAAAIEAGATTNQGAA